MHPSFDMRFVIACAAALVLGTTGFVSAATFNASISGGLCGENSSGSQTVIVSCNSDDDPNSNITSGLGINGVLSSARSQAGNLGVAAGAVRVVGPDGDANPDNFDTMVSALYTDVLSFGIDEGTITLSSTFSGRVEVEVTRPGFPSPSFGRISYQISGGGATVTGGISSSIGQNNVLISSGSTGPATAVARFSGGQLTLETSMASTASCGNLGNVFGEINYCRVQTSGLGSLTFDGAVVRDVNGVVVEDAFIGSSSGFDYISGYTPATVPLPATGWALIAAISSLALWRRRQVARSVVDGVAR